MYVNLHVHFHMHRCYRFNMQILWTMFERFIYLLTISVEQLVTPVFMQYEFM